VEGKQHTLTVAGAVFVGLVMAPLVLTLMSPTWNVPVVAGMASMTVAYVFGEGLGRLACISFGCCYGKPLYEIDGAAYDWFERFHFAFYGATKKISYASNLEGVAVVPIQALTAVLYVILGLAGTLLFLTSHFNAAFLLALAGSQIWRLYSETLRADYR